MVPLPAALAAWAGAGQGKPPPLLLAWRIDTEP